MAALDDIAERHDVAERLAHLAPVDFDVIVMEPHLCKLFARHALRLGDFIGMMHRDVVNPSRMNVNLIPQCLARDH